LRGNAEHPGIAAVRLRLAARARREFEALVVAFDIEPERAVGRGKPRDSVLHVAPVVDRLAIDRDEAVAAFLDQRLAFLAIAEVVERCLDTIAASPVDSLEALLDVDLTARRQAQRIIAAIDG
jgi:hypothetical protein